MAGPSSGSTSPPWVRARRSSPYAVAVYVGYPPSSLATVPGTGVVTAIQPSPAPEVFTPFFRYAFGVGVLAVLFPVLILIGTATRLAAARREERFAALRLVGATPRDVNVIASVDSVVSALTGSVLGIGLFLAIRPALAGASLTGIRYFEATVTPTAWGYLVMLVAVPAASAVAALAALRRVRISPLGVSRRVPPPPPSARRLGPLVVGVALFVTGLLATTKKSIGASAYPGLLLTMVGLVIAGPWLTAVSARWCARVLNGASPLLAARRLADNPRAAFRAVRGLVLAVFLGTMVGALVPAVESLEASSNATALDHVLLDTFSLESGNGFGPGLAPRAGGALVSGLRAIGGTTVYPLYLLPQATNPNYQGQDIGVVSCPALRALAVLGQCAAGAQAVQVNDADLVYSDNPRNSTRGLRQPGRSGLHRKPGRAAPAGRPGQGDRPGHLGAGPHVPGPPCAPGHLGRPGNSGDPGHRLRDVDPDRHPASPTGHSDTTARPRVLRHHGRRAGHRADRDRRDAAPAQAHDRPR